MQDGRPTAGRRHGRGRGRGQRQEPVQETQDLDFESKISQMLSKSVLTEQHAEAAPLSFESKIALALQGSNWQQLEGVSTSVAEEPSIQHGENVLVEAAENGLELTHEQSQQQWHPTAKQKKKMATFVKTIARDAGDVLATIAPGDVVPTPCDVTWDAEPELLCSYNWHGASDGTNTIFVPGAPAKWHMPTLPHTLKPDSGFQYTDYNYARKPRDPYMPMFHALKVMNPDYQFNDVDVIAERNSLRVLLEFCQGKSNGPFRLNLHLIYNTLIIVRRESKWWSRANGESFGGNFEKFFTRPVEGMEDATSHYRAIRYSMGPLNVVCRFEADAYDDGVKPDILTESEVITVNGRPTERPMFDFRAPIKVLQEGYIVPTAQLVELKTQKYTPREFRLVACQDQLWFGRTSLLFTGPYEGGSGIVKKIKFEDATERVKRWEIANQGPLRKLVTLLSMLREVLKRERRPNHAVVLVREDRDGPLSVRSMEGNDHAIGREFFANHWRTTRQQPSFRGAHLGQRGSARGSFATHRGRGNQQAHGTVNGSQSEQSGHAMPSRYSQGRGKRARGQSSRGERGA